MTAPLIKPTAAWRTALARRGTVEFMRFCVVGASGVLVNLGVYLLLTRLASVPLEWASPIAIEVSILSNFLANDRWTFSARRMHHGILERLVNFHVVCALGGAVNYGLLLLLVKVYGWWDVYANLAGIVLGVGLKFGVSSLWTWRELR